MALTPNFLLQILDKIGVPLASAVEDVAGRNKSVQLSDVDEAKIMAQLIGQTIQIILPLSGSIIQGTNEQEADAVRLALSGIAAPLVAGIYRTQGRAPNENDIRRIVKAMEATLAFSDNFNPAIGQDSRLKMLGEDSFVLDTAQVDISTLNTLVPVMNAIGEFSFGQSETKLLQDVSNKLIEKAASISQSVDKLAELSVLKTLASLYAQCHRTETVRLSSGGDDNRGELSIGSVWQAFDKRLAMVGTILGMPPMPQSSGSVSPAPQVQQQPNIVAPVSPAGVSMATAPQQMAQPQPVLPQPTPVAPPPIAQPPVKAPPPVAQGGGGPMSFFKGPAPQVPVTQPTQSPQQVAPSSVTPATPAAVTQPPQQTGTASSPMSFFKAPQKTTDDQSGS